MNKNLLNKLSNLSRVIFMVTLYVLFLFVQGEVQGEAQGGCPNNCGDTEVCINNSCYKDISSVNYYSDIMSNGQCVFPNYDTATNCQSCEGNWDIYNDCKTCIGWFDSETSCDDCINYNFKDNSCSLCKKNYDINTGCKACVAKYDLTSACKECKFPFIGDECSYIACTRDSDIDRRLDSSYSWDCGTYGSCDTDNGVCICSDNMLPDCTGCINERLDSAGCSSCKNEKLDIATLCATCTDTNLLATQDSASTCTTCVSGPLYSTEDCNTCIDTAYNPFDGCKVCLASPKLDPSPNIKCTKCINSLLNSINEEPCSVCNYQGYNAKTQCTTCIRTDFYLGPDSEISKQDNCNRCMQDSERRGAGALWDTSSCTSCINQFRDTEKDCIDCIKPYLYTNDNCNECVPNANKFDPTMGKGCYKCLWKNMIETDSCNKCITSLLRDGNVINSNSNSDTEFCNVNNDIYENLEKVDLFSPSKINIDMQWSSWIKPESESRMIWQSRGDVTNYEVKYYKERPCGFLKACGCGDWTTVTKQSPSLRCSVGRETKYIKHDDAFQCKLREHRYEGINCQKQVSQNFPVYKNFYNPLPLTLNIVNYYKEAKGNCDGRLPTLDELQVYLTPGVLSLLGISKSSNHFLVPLSFYGDKNIYNGKFADVYMGNVSSFSPSVDYVHKCENGCNNYYNLSLCFYYD